MTRKHAGSTRAIFKDAIVTDYNGLTAMGVLVLCASEYLTKGVTFMFGLFLAVLILDIVVMSGMVRENFRSLDKTIKGTFGKHSNLDKTLLEWQVKKDFVRDLERARKCDSQTEEGIERRCMVLPFVLAVILYCVVNSFVF